MSEGDGSRRDGSGLQLHGGRKMVILEEDGQLQGSDVYTRQLASSITSKEASMLKFRLNFLIFSAALQEFKKGSDYE